MCITMTLQQKGAQHNLSDLRCILSEKVCTADRVEAKVPYGERARREALKIEIAMLRVCFASTARPLSYQRVGQDLRTIEPMPLGPAYTAGWVSFASTWGVGESDATLPTTLGVAAI